jgi:hypothetical protein
MCEDSVMNLVPDHLVVCVDDLDEADGEFRSRFGLGSVPGGSHPGHGTANRIVPLGDSYIELVAVVDAPEASRSAFGKWVATGTDGSLEVGALCLRTDDIQAVTDRLGIDPTAMSRKRPDGTTLSWRIAGVEQTISEGLPFFIEWDVPNEELPGMTSIAHPVGDAHLKSVTLHGHKEQLANWVGAASTVEVVTGRPAITAIVGTSSGDVFF